MTNIKLSKRLLKIASLVDKDSVIADIGCDHALLDIYLIQNKIVKKAYACDIAKGALEQAQKNISLWKVKNIETRLGSGLDVISKKDGINTIVISGLGNQKISDILKENLNVLNCVQTIIIQSNTRVSQVRKSIIKLGYYIDDEKLVEERGIIYTIIKFQKGIRYYNKRQLSFGPILLENKDELFYKLLKEKIISKKLILNNIPKRKIIKRLEIYRKINLLKKEKSAN